MINKYPTLYSFRRCPYAMRARLAIRLCKIQCIIREISLKAKNSEFLRVSPKATVPVLVLPNGEVLEESLDIIYRKTKKSILNLINIPTPLYCYKLI